LTALPGFQEDMEYDFLLPPKEAAGAGAGAEYEAGAGAAGAGA